MKKISIILNVICLFLITSCSQEDSGDSALSGVWVRVNGASGDRTEIAIGGIEGESENRVYMCEKRGSSTAGLYKGYLDGDVITWDDTHNLPLFYVYMDGGQLIVDVDCDICIDTPYDRGSWSGECGLLEMQDEYKLAVGLNNDLFPDDIVINNVTIDNIPVPLTLLNNTVTEADCSTHSFVQLGEPLQEYQGSGYYLVRITFSGQGVSGPYTTEHQMAIYKAHLEPGCNVRQVADTGTGRYGLIPM